MMRQDKVIGRMIGRGAIAITLKVKKGVASSLSLNSLTLSSLLPSTSVSVSVSTALSISYSL
jgi:hypothetical protein